MTERSEASRDPADDLSGSSGSSGPSGPSGMPGTGRGEGCPGCSGPHSPTCPARPDGSAAALGDYRAAFHAARLPLAVLNRDGLVLAANPAFGDLVGTEPDELVAATAADLTDLGADPRIWSAYREVLCGRSDRLRCTRRLQLPDGHSMWAEVTVEPLAPGAGLAPGGALNAGGTPNDARGTLNGSGTRTAGGELPAATDLSVPADLPVPADMSVPTDLPGSSDLPMDGDLPAMDGVPPAGGGVRAGAGQRAEEDHVLLSVADISDRHDLLARLRHLQMHDPVTRLPNRALFFERLAGALESAAFEQGGTGRIGLCYLDLDGFKAVNDTLGHRVGDRLLSAVAQRLRHCVEELSEDRLPAPPDGPTASTASTTSDASAMSDASTAMPDASTASDASTAFAAPVQMTDDDTGHLDGSGHLVARLGGDEFALLVEDSTGTEQLAALAQRVLDALQRPFDLAGQRLSVSASIGVVERAATGTTATGLMQAADTTLYWAKEDGKARWTLFDPERNAHRMTRQALSSTLRPAVERGEFTLEYQPLVGLGDGRAQGVEALVRWRHPQFGTLSPNRFIGLAEENGAIVELGRWVLERACRQARAWQLERPGAQPLFVSVNVAVRQVWDSDLVADVAHILAETGLPPRLLQLELTESAVMGSAGRPLQALQALSDMGVRIAIDDFGTGYSNLAYLSRLPVSVLKLDGSFVRGFRAQEHPNPADETIVEALVALAHRLGLTVTAECVESAEQAERLRRIGCDTGQGWLYSRPVAPDRVSALISAGRRTGS
ncbi:GGDEF domain-containing protein [Streptomyces sp. MST-110588]|uniref:putative bifunctional diguanylate cyclase/phosphodiesterase n=1 Tax=Streptomyces sp. MST-110588 TaxID=2833628 RepID=UPI001F5C8753|nr:GGDEF domain-containing protein [Streptomyces sp. MST-110588]